MNYYRTPIRIGLILPDNLSNSVKSAILFNILLTVILPFYLSCLTLSAQPFQLPEPEHITDRQGLPQAFVSSIVQDEKGFIWMATLDGFCRYDGNRFKVFQPQTSDSTGLSGPDVVGIQTDHNAKLLIITQEHLDLFDLQSETFLNLSQQPFYKEYFKKLPTVVYPDRRQRIWLSNHEGLSVIDLKTSHVRTYRHQQGNPQTLSNDWVNAIVEDHKGTIWVGTKEGLNKLDEKTGSFTQYLSLPDVPGTLPDNDITGLYPQPDGQLFIVSPEHVALLEPDSERIKSYRIKPLQISENNKRQTRVPIAADSKGNLFFSQYENMYRFNEGEGVTGIISKKSIATGIIGIHIDRSDVLWVGTSGSGVYKYNLKATAFYTHAYIRNFHSDLLKNITGLPEDQLPFFSPATSSYYFRYTLDGLSRVWFNVGSSPFHYIDPTTKKITKVPLPVSFRNEYPSTPVPLATDPEGHVWVLYDSLAMWYDDSGKKWQIFPHLIELSSSEDEPVRAWNQTHIIEFVIDQTYLWIATDKEGLYRVDRQTGATKHFSSAPRDKASISSDLLFCLFDDPDDPDILWIGTFGAGLCRFSKSTGESMVFNTDNGLPNNVIYAAIPDQEGNIWIATNRGLCRMNRKTFKKRLFTSEDGLLAEEFNRFHFIQQPDGRISLGGLTGITSFYPNEIIDDAYQPEVEITGMLVNNVALEARQSSMSDSLAFQQLKEIHLKYNQNSLKVEFAGLQYNSYKNLKYRYKLEGQDKNWINPERGEALYTNLSPGKYTLKLNTSNTAGVWSPYIRNLSVIISPPWWASWWAYMIYTLIAVYIGYVLIRLYLKEKETQQLHALDELKTRFFSNITHDFRTPLTLILGPAQQLRSSLNVEKKTSGNFRHIDTIERNALQLLQLVNQLLDLSKAESKALEVETVRGNLIRFITQLLASFQAHAAQKQIALSFHPAIVTDKSEYFFDPGKLERILYNLISNALKFTEEGGKVEIYLTAAESGILVTIADTGCGIPAKKLPHIFNRFYQVNDTRHFHQQGSGIGLSLVKELVDLQGGRINVSSTVDVGTTFDLYLPYALVKTEDTAQPDPTAPQTCLLNGRQYETPFQTVQILIVEDNQELAAFIADCLPATYTVSMAKNGEEAFEEALHTLPDLIISDVMMPVMDGFTFCRMIKEDIRTSHIPVILLTAKISHESKITGLTFGADEYLTKPFHPEELQLRVQNVLEHQKRQRDWIQSQLMLPDTEIIRLDSGEKMNPFLKKLFSLLENHLDNASFGIEDIATDLGMSRMTLFRKVKTLTGYSTSDLIRNYRLNRATELLKEGVTISETAYKVGFNSLAYFSKCFRDVYQMTPSEFIQKQG